MMTTRIQRPMSWISAVIGLALVLVASGQAEQRDEINLVIGGDVGRPPSFAVPDCLALTPDKATGTAAQRIAEVLWDDLDFEREFNMIPRDVYNTIPAARSIGDLAFDRWAELGADGVVSCSVRALSATQLEITARLFSVRSQDNAFSVQYTGANQNIRRYAHQLSDEIHRQQRGVEGVARTQIAFVSDRDGDSVLGLVENRPVKEVYFADYDGANMRRVTVTRTLNLFPSWSPDGRAIGYTSYLSGFPDVVMSHLFEGRMTTPASGTMSVHNSLSAFSPDGLRVAFNSNRDNSSDIYVANVDGTNVRRLTSNPAIDTSPTWSPNGQQIAFTSDRAGQPQIYVMGADGTGLRRLTYESYCDRPTWSPAPFNEVAYSSKTGPGHDIKVLDLATNEVRQLTFGLGSNESPSYSPNGRHIAFTSSRGSGLKQIYTIDRDGKNLRRLTSTGNNETPSWSR
jgi:TolB protein